jgi:hypothetical protein
MRALVVGAGVVGQVHGRHLARGGADVGFLVKPEHVEECRAGFTLYPLNRPPRRRAEPERFTGYGVYGSAAGVARERWDQVYLAVPSDALRVGSWFASLAQAVGDATVVLLQPGPEDRAFVLAEVPESRVVQGIITLLGYRAPLPGETRFPAPGTAYWFPPLAPSPMGGTAARVGPVVRALRAGGLPARRLPAVPALADLGGALMIPPIAALELAGWRLDRFRREHLPLALRASREAMSVVAHRRGRRPPAMLRLAARPAVVRPLLRIAPLLTPFDLESYLRAHFTKVGDQTKDVMRTYLAWGESGGLPTAALAALGA